MTEKMKTGTPEEDGIYVVRSEGCLFVAAYENNEWFYDYIYEIKNNNSIEWLKLNI